ncbi:MAG: MCE family protein [Pseudonocardia sp.]|nr:MCE family protein [Pseudonocardia sp.]
MTRRIGRVVTARLAAFGAVAGLLTGCGSVSLQNVPLPGGADLGAHPFEVTVQFRDVLDLVPQSAVRVNNVTVGSVRAIDLDPKTWSARVKVALNGDIRLPANATAQLRQTALLGEKYVLLAGPTDGPPEGDLTDGAVIPLARTGRNPTAEEIFGALSMLLNGGGLGHVQNIARELNKALAGNESDVRALLTDLNVLTSTLDAERGNISRALDGVDRLSAQLVEQRANLDKVLTDLEPGLAVLNRQRRDLVHLLESLDRLSRVTVNVVNRSRDDLIADLRALRPTLRELARAGDTIPRSLQLLLTPPFTDSAIPTFKGDYENLTIKLDLNVQDLINNLSRTPPGQLPIQLPDDPLRTLPSVPGNTVAVPDLPLPGAGHPSAPRLPGGLAVPGLGGG